MLALGASLLLGITNGAMAQAAVGCTSKAPCQSLNELLALQGASSNATLFAEADAACGGDALTMLVPVVLACSAELEVPIGCPCSTPTCKPAINGLKPACIEAMVSTLCTEAHWLDAELMVNLRGIFQHLGNDCAQMDVSCPANVPDFDTEICSTDDTALAPAASAPELAPAESTRSAPLPPPAADTTDTTEEVTSGVAGTLAAGAATLALTAAAML